MGGVSLKWYFWRYIIVCRRGRFGAKLSYWQCFLNIANAQAEKLVVAFLAKSWYNYFINKSKPYKERTREYSENNAGLNYFVPAT